jgi:hypothetical protein
LSVLPGRCCAIFDHLVKITRLDEDGNAIILDEMLRMENVMELCSRNFRERERESGGVQL